jgi:hypothetical protein
MPKTIWEVFVRLLRHLLDRRDAPLQGGVPHPRRRQRMQRSERQVLGHAFGEPERGHELRERLHAVARLSAREHVVLERVHHLVREHVLEAAVVTGEVEQHPVAQRLGHAAGAFSQVAGDVVLPEVTARRIQHDRLLLAELMAQDRREARVRSLRHSSGVIGGALFGRVVEDLEVLRIQVRPGEPVVLNLVLTEIALSGQRTAAEDGRSECRQQPPRQAVALVPWSIGMDSASAHSRSSW